VPAQYTIGFVETTRVDGVRDAILSATQELSVRLESS
jgi:hypothetical protein